MRCQICQTDGHSFIYKGKECCDGCYGRFFARTKPDGTGYAFLNGMLEFLWINCTDGDDKPFMIVFNYFKKRTIFVRGVKEVAIINEIKPATDEFIEKASKHIKTWQVFS